MYTMRRRLVGQENRGHGSTAQNSSEVILLNLAFILLAAARPYPRTHQPACLPEAECESLGLFGPALVDWSEVINEAAT